MSDNNLNCKISTYKPTDYRVAVGRFTYGDPHILLWGENERVIIGSFCSIAQNVKIFGGGEHNHNWVTTYPLRIAFGHSLAEKDGHPRTKGKTIIGNDVWIGYGAVILSGVVVGDGAVIGAGSIVSKDVPSYSIVAGNPSTIVRYRFDPQTIEKLLEIAWWKWPIEKIEANISLLCNEDIDLFLSRYSIG